MKISINCLNLLKELEGCKLTAYTCPAGVWTIGYGTTVYPDGRKVSQGDTISQQQADAFLLDECRDKAKTISELVRVPLTQNQFDAIVSFVYNIGEGAFEESTLLRKLNDRDYEGAAAEFKRWNKITQNGQKVVCDGLVNRRKKEEALFRKAEASGTPLDLESPLEPPVNWLELYRDRDRTVLVAYHDDRIVETIALKTTLKEDFIELLQQYPKAKTIHIAPAEKSVPQSDRVEFYGRKTPRDLGTPPPLKHKVIKRGMRDKHAEYRDIQTLQQRLQELGYYHLEIDGIFGRGTENAVKAFQADVFGSAEVDGKVGSRTWTMLWSDLPKPEPDSSESDRPQGTYLYLTKTNRKDRFGCYILNLEYVKNGKVRDRLEVCSGQAYAQHFRIGIESKAGSMEPLPEGKWYVNNIIWADSKDRYDGGVFPNGLGPVTTPIKYVEPQYTQRSAIEIHIDWNNRRPAGTAGCVGIYNIADYKKFVTWLRDTDPRDLYVDWGLGTCPKQ
ncbi:glycoside hydrolase family protein [Baaleninema simplex]|uniref:glycoside hydrolase family protein n=1 Tax=Baaleninema simplex TaxID=2862350 RepID=UPI000345BEA1|nr:glycoside hydrolase family protein [Baaleninema simplex]